MSEDIQLYRLPRVRAYIDEVEMNISAAQFLYKNGSYDLAVTFPYLFWPEFLEFDDCIVLHSQAELVPGWMEQMDGDHTSVEAILNHTHLDFVLGNKAERNLAAFEYLVEIIKRTWKAALAEQFPNRRFEFGFTNDDDPTLTVWQVRAPTNGDSV